MANTTAKTKITLKKWDSAEHLETEEDMALYLEACCDYPQSHACTPLKTSRGTRQRLT